MIEKYFQASTWLQFKKWSLTDVDKAPSGTINTINISKAFSNRDNKFAKSYRVLDIREKKFTQIVRKLSSVKINTREY